VFSFSQHGYYSSQPNKFSKIWAQVPAENPAPAHAGVVHPVPRSILHGDRDRALSRPELESLRRSPAAQPAWPPHGPQHQAAAQHWLGREGEFGSPNRVAGADGTLLPFPSASHIVKSRASCLIKPFPGAEGKQNKKSSGKQKQRQM